MITESRLKSDGIVRILCICLPILACVALGISISEASAAGGGLTFTFNQNVTKKFSTNSITCVGSSTLVPDNHVFPGAMCLLPDSFNDTVDLYGRCFYNEALTFARSNPSFSTMFSFTTLIYDQFTPGQGFTFFISSQVSRDPSSIGEYLGLLNQSTNGKDDSRTFAVEFDIHHNPKYDSLATDHVGININDMRSIYSKEASGIYNLTTHTTNERQYAWIDYDGDTGSLLMSLNDEPRKPCEPFISYQLISDDQNRLANLWDGSSGIYVGFSSSSGGADNYIVAQTTIWDWSFNTNGKAENIYAADERCGWSPSLTLTLTLIISVLSIAIILLIGLIIMLRRRVGSFKYEKAKLEDEKAELVAELKDLDYGAREFSSQELKEATNGFTESIGAGGFGTVYKGTLPKLGPNASPVTVAVKKIKRTADLEDARQLVAEVKIIGRLRHVNIVPLLGWCHEKEQMFLVYKYMERGDLEMHMFPTDSPELGVFPWQTRMRVLKGVAAALLFLHDEFESEQRILHRDIKPRNVMIDAQFNARLGDFGLARLLQRKSNKSYDNGVIMGTPGYMAPEFWMGGTAKTDVYSFGVLALVVATGRNALDKTLPGGLVQWVRSMHDEGTILKVADKRLVTEDNFDPEEMERVLRIGLFCCLFEPGDRPKMREVFIGLHGESSSLSCPMPRQVPEPLPVHNLDIFVSDFDCSSSDYQSRFDNSQGGTPDFQSDQELFLGSQKFSIKVDVR